MMEDWVLNIRKELVDREDGYIQRFENHLAKVVKTGNLPCLSSLFQLFQLEDAPEELLFFVVHALEQLDNPAYFQAVLANIESFFERSPCWAVIFHMRIMNSPAALTAYSEFLKTMPPQKLAIVRKVLDAVKLKNPKLSSRCDHLLNENGSETGTP